MKDFSIWSLVFTNVIILINAWVNKSSFSELIWIYWWQTVFIFFFMALKLIFSKISEDTNLPVLLRIISKIFVTVIYIFGASVILFVLFFTLLTMGGGEGYSEAHYSVVEVKNYLWMVGLLFINHLFSFIYNFKSDRNNGINTTRIMSSLFRAVPIVFGLILSNVLNSAGFVSILIFVLFKIGLEIKLHIEEHKIMVDAREE